MLLEERAPFIVEVRSVGLNGVIDLLARLPVFLNQLNRATKKIQSHERRFTALPGNGYRLRLLRLQELANVDIQQIVSHTEIAIGIKSLLGEKEAVLAIEIAH